MAQVRKYANLPDLDSAPDIYETPDLIEDSSTIPASTAALSASPSSSYSDSSDEDDTGINRRRLQPDQARSHFLSARVDARDVDFSDRVSHPRRSYRTSSRHQRQNIGISSNELGDLSDDENEAFEHKLARLRKEVEEIKYEFEKRQAENSNAPGVDKLESGGEDPAEGISHLSDLLDAVYVHGQGGITEAEAQLVRTIGRFSKASESRSGTQDGLEGIASARSTQVPRIQPSYVLAKAAEFDSRLSLLERHLGLSGSTMPDLADRPPKPILHTLGNLEQTLSTVAAATSTSLDAASQSVRKLIQEAERLDELRRSAHASNELNLPANQRNTRDSTALNGDSKSLEETERMSKINALYGTLPTIDSLSPTLPLILDRLRTLRLIHSSAGAASSMLEEVERRQAEQESEIKQWREALEKVEEKIQEGEGNLLNNVKVVGDWVKDLEARISKFA
ncbi:hypothetical protein AOQ84DRAFT_443770 [Glonium stellatum]|uniref:Uncharacterized protein n=1 Tax=Glonium stellatum TaxID=574774 RepID=A0A8E2EN57_9PEZI|nr:hypothetical protein AOQ84DRAFT_443770 [Glonium stellatum]